MLWWKKRQFYTIYKSDIYSSNWRQSKQYDVAVRDIFGETWQFIDSTDFQMECSRQQQYLFSLQWK